MDFFPRKVEDFLQEESFVEWVRNPTDSSDVFWQHWCDAYPQWATQMKQAKEIILHMEYQQTHTLTETEIQDLFVKIKTIQATQENSQ